MFDAVIAKKAKMQKILHDAKRNPREDLVTSSLFGSLRLLVPEARCRALGALCGENFPVDGIIYLWPFFVSDNETSEPDVVLEFLVDGRRFYWIVEVKWGASLGVDQSAREINTVSKGFCRRGGVLNGARDVIGYTLLGAEPKHANAMAALAEKFVVRPKIVSLKWSDTCENLRSLSVATDDPGLKVWALLSADFLAGQPQGAVLGHWPIMTLPNDVSFNFNIEESFPLPPMTVVPVTSSSFREKNDPS